MIKNLIAKIKELLFGKKPEVVKKKAITVKKKAVAKKSAVNTKSVSKTPIKK